MFGIARKVRKLAMRPGCYRRRRLGLCDHRLGAAVVQPMSWAGEREPRMNAVRSAESGLRLVAVRARGLAPIERRVSRDVIEAGCVAVAEEEADAFAAVEAAPEAYAPAPSSAASAGLVAARTAQASR